MWAVLLVYEGEYFLDFSYNENINNMYIMQWFSVLMYNTICEVCYIFRICVTICYLTFSSTFKFVIWLQAHCALMKLKLNSYESQ